MSEMHRYVDACQAAVGPLVEALRGQHIHAGLLHTGGGLFVLEVPLDEKHSRVMWLGFDETGDEMLVNSHPPTANELVVGCVYDGHDGDHERYGVLDPQRHDGTLDSLCSAVRSAGWQAIAYPTTEMTEL